jgi:hypothetical protein
MILSLPAPVLIDAVVIGASVVLLVSAAGYVYLDAPEYGMEPKKWAAISFFIPIFGFFTYLFEREERTPEEDRDEFIDKAFEVHESRADDVGFRDKNTGETEREDELDRDEWE